LQTAEPQQPPEKTVQNTSSQNERDDLEIGDDLTITKTTRRAAGTGTWVCGRMNGHRFDALVFPEHAEQADYELDQSQISKLFVQRLHDRQTVANFDRGWDVRPTTDEAAAIVDFLCAGLADHIFKA
jgi:ribosomal protein L25 (general stress protein Ctc)